MKIRFHKPELSEYVYFTDYEKAARQYKKTMAVISIILSLLLCAAFILLGVFAPQVLTWILGILAISALVFIFGCILYHAFTEGMDV